MALKIEIDGVDKTSIVLWRSLTWDQALTSQVDTLKFKIFRYGSRTFKPTLYDEVVLKDDGTTLFGGVIVNVTESVDSVERETFDITVKDYSEEMDRRLVADNFEDKPAINIIIEILNRYINRGSRVEMASFESTETWSGGAIDTDNYRLGDRARKVTSNGSIETMYRNIYLNLQPTGFATTDYMDIDAYVDDVTKLESAVIKVGDADLTNYYSKDITSDLTSDGWNLSHSLLSSFSSTGAPDWTNIRRIQLEVKALAANTVVVTFDNWQVIKSSAFTRNNSFNATQEVKWIAFNYEYPSQCLKRLADMFQWEWYVDENKDIHFFAKFEVGSPFNLADTNGTYVYDSLVIKNSTDQLRNSIYVRGSDYLGPTITEDLSQQADGSNKIFLLGYQYKNVSLEVNGVSIPVGTSNLDDFVDNQGSKQILQGGLGANIGDVLANTYQSLQVIVGKSGRRGSMYLRLRTVGAPADNIQVQIFSDNGSNEPSSTALSTVSAKSGGTLTGSFDEYIFDLTEVLTNDLFFDTDDKYHIVLSRSGGLDAANYYQVEYIEDVEYQGYAYTGDNVPAWTQKQWTLYFVETIDYDVLYNFTEKHIVFSTAPTGGDTIEWTGDPYYPIFVLYSDGTSIAEYGIKQFKVTDLSIKTREGAKQRALQEILSWAESSSDASFKTYSSGLRAGQTINIQSDIRGLDEYYMIQRITARARSSESLEYQITALTKRSYGIIYWLQQQIMKDDRQTEIQDDGAEDKIEAIFESISFTTEYSTTLYTGKVWGVTGVNDLVWNGGAEHIWI